MIFPLDSEAPESDLGVAPSVTPEANLWQTLLFRLTQPPFPTSFSCTVSILEARKTNIHFAASTAARSGHMTILAIETKGEVCWQLLKRLLLLQIKLTDASGATPSPTFQPYRCTVGSCSHLATRRKTKAKRSTETLALMLLSQQTNARSS